MNSSSTWASVVWEKSFLWRTLFYFVTPSETSPKSLEETPDLVGQIIPVFFVLIVTEAICCQMMSGRFRLNDGVTSMSHAVILRVFELIGEKNLELTMYTLAYNNLRLSTFESDSMTTWIIAAFGTDHGYYWAHRMMHECNIIWAAHQVHHSGQDFNFATGMRQSLFQKYFSWPFYLPMAIMGIPPHFWLMHMGLNLMYQFWIHTELLDGLGPVFNYFFNCPKHHQVHHGRNPYCVDKNYAGTLIIWDRMYGTFADRDADVHYEGEKIAYGLIPPIDSFNFFTIQLHSYRKLFRRFLKTPGITSKFKTLWFGPGWSANRKSNLRMGDPAELPKIKISDVKKFHNPKIGLSLGLYAFFQLSLSVLILDHFLNAQTDLLNKDDANVKYSFETGAIWVIWIFWALWSVSEIVEGRCLPSEIVRTALTGMFFIQPEMFGERIRLPEALSVPFLFSTVWALGIRLTKK